MKLICVASADFMANVENLKTDFLTINENKWIKQFADLSRGHDDSCSTTTMCLKTEKNNESH